MSLDQVRHCDVFPWVGNCVAPYEIEIRCLTHGPGGPPLHRWAPDLSQKALTRLVAKIDAAVQPPKRKKAVKP